MEAKSRSEKHELRTRHTTFSGKGCPYDNPCIESFHASLKKEEVHLVNYFDYDTARLAIFEYRFDFLA